MSQPVGRDGDGGAIKAMRPRAKGTVSLLLAEVFKTPSGRSARAFGPNWGGGVVK